MCNEDYIYHPEELESAEKEKRPILLSQLFRYDHLQHNIPLGSLVEVDIEVVQHGSDGVEVNLKGRCKLFVVRHHRDCDGTPLYVLSDIPVVVPTQTFSDQWFKYQAIAQVYQTGINESRLKLLEVKGHCLLRLGKWLECNMLNAKELVFCVHSLEEREGEAVDYPCEECKGFNIITLCPAAYWEKYECLPDYPIDDEVEDLMPKGYGLYGCCEETQWYARKSKEEIVRELTALGLSESKVMEKFLTGCWE